MKEKSLYAASLSSSKEIKIKCFKRVVVDGGGLKVQSTVEIL